MLEYLTQEQIDKFPFYVQKWCDIGYNTDPLNFDETVKHVKDAYKVAKLEPPKYFMHFGSPFSALHAIFMVDVLSNFNDAYTDKTVHSDTANWLPIFESMYDQYSSQYKEKDVNWNSDTKARMLSYISKQYNDTNVKTKLHEYFNSMMYGAHDAAWLSFYDFFYQEFGLECINDLVPSFEIAKNCGWWSAFSEIAFLQDRPTKIVINDQNLLHNESGPAIEYADGYKIYCLEGRWFPEVVVMDPHLITPAMVEGEQNAEKRRIILQRYGYEKYFFDAKCEVIDQDQVQVEIGNDRTMPRMLIKTAQNDLFLVGSDGSTERVYVMPVLQDVKTCKEAHELISGLKEENCLAQS